MKRIFKDKKCEICRNEFTPKSGVQKYCEQCKINMLRKQKREANRRAKIEGMKKALEYEKTPTKKSKQKKEKPIKQFDFEATVCRFIIISSIIYIMLIALTIVGLVK